MSILTINEIVTERAANGLLTSVDEIEQEVTRRILAILRNADTTGGNFDFKDGANELIIQIRNEVQDVIFSSSLPTAVDEYLDEFDVIEDNVIQIQKNFNGIDVSPTVISSAKVGAVQSVQANLLGAGVDANFVNPIQDLLYQRINLGASVVDTERILRNMVQGVEGKNGLLTRWVGQASRDAINQYEGNTQQIIKKEFDLNAWAYVGNIVKDSRAQCRRWVKKERILDSEIERELAYMYSSGSGAIPGTDKYNFGVNRGGYNCRHKAIPTRVTTKGRKTRGPGKKAEPEVVDTNRPTTIAQASKFAVDNKLAREVDYKAIGIKEAETANRINNKIQELQDKYGLLELNIISKVRKRRVNASANGETLNLNPTYFNGGYKKAYQGDVADFKKNALKNLEEWERIKADKPNLFEGRASNAVKNRKALRSIQEAAKFERWTAKQKGQEIESTIVHEFGHVIHDQKLGGINRSLRKFGEKGPAGELNAEIWNTYRDALKNGDIYKISQYGASNDKEFFAEAFVMYEFERDRLPGYIVDLIEKVLNFGI
jgi:hypothetical protein